ncbi:hypothetical protein MLD38_022398 [Melastoma candidum]|uniref:Uncharacterized protein n=1 Tax=Melastoma candidum TaxID=119954 RepID=A0ACB9QMH4_9MYRT|nr:hypothetical protein MLD38_022398 [Melastoma candidum]
MLQRAAGNAYSWWWASHIRTKQSKWLEQSLQDMEDKVKVTLKIIDDDGDSFAKRAEMYYRKRPELINFVEESYRAYRALAERYDHLSRELQSANRKIATAFPDEVHFEDDDSDEESISSGYQTPKDPLDAKRPGIPKVPKPPAKNFLMGSGRGRPKQMAEKVTLVPASGLTQAEALVEIDKIHKEILALQTEKEFVKSWYEHGYARYWEIEGQINELQGSICNLQDEFRIESYIEDNEARKLMAETALKSCKEALYHLKDQEEQSAEEVRMQDGSIDKASKKIGKLKRELLSPFEENESTASERKAVNTVDVRDGKPNQEGHHLATPDGNPRACLTVSDLVERIDELVNKVVNLETEVSSQSALVKKLQSETDSLNAHVQTLEEEKETLMGSSENVKIRVKELEKGLEEVRNMKQCFHERDRIIISQFNEASSNLERLSEKLQEVKLDAEVEDAALFQDHRKSKTPSEELHQDGGAAGKSDKGDILFVSGPCSEFDTFSEKETPDLYGSVDLNPDRESLGGRECEDQPNWRQLFLEGMEDREKILFEEYTTILRSYKDVKNKLSDVEKTNRDGLFEMAMQIKELRSNNATKDQEIVALRRKLGGSDAETVVSHEDTLQEATEDGGDQKQSGSPKQPLYRLLLKQNEKFVGSLSDRELRGNITSVEETLRTEIDRMLEENLEFWLRFSTSIHMVQKFQTTVHDLQVEVVKLMEKHQEDESSSDSNHRRHISRSDARPIYKHLQEIQSELRMWLEHNSLLKEEQQNRSISLLRIQDDISKLAMAKPGERQAVLNEYQAAKFHGEVTNMEQENNKVAYQLQAGLDRVKKLQGEIERSLTRLEECMGMSGGFRSGKFLGPSGSSSSGGSSGKHRLPLRSFLFGVKLKKQYKQKQSSLFSCMTPVLQKQYSDLRSAGNARLPPPY